jgi:glycosyltransferase involved in cell wall biosynthesis
MPTVSVLLPTYSRNASGSLAAAIESVLAQTFDDFELIAVDDGSVDGSEETIRQFMARDGRVRTIRFGHNIGLPALTTAHAFLQSRGRYIAWQFDDCLWTKNHLTVLIATIEKHEADIAHAMATSGRAEDGESFGAPLDAERLEGGHNHIPNAATLVRRELYETVGWVDPHVLLKRNNDWDFWTRASARRARFAFVPEVVATENGFALHDSLTHSVTLDLDLIARYRTIDRNAALHPSRIAEWHPFATPDFFSDGERERLAFLIVEHFERVRRLGECAQHLSWMPDGDLRTWYLEETIRRQRERLYEQDAYIQKQRHLLDERYELIVALQKQLTG